MKKIIFSVAVVSLLAFAGRASAQMGMMPAGQSFSDGWGNYWYGAGRSAEPVQTAELENALQEIYASQAVSDRNQIDCAKVGDNQFEKLGDAYMGVMIGNDQTHEAMDNMMGGEGSQSLAEAHINMGRSYLGCWSNYNSGPVYMPMMYANQGFGGYGMMGGRNYGYGGFPMMFGWGGYGTGNMIFMSAWSILAVIGIIAIVKRIVNANKK